MRRNLEREENMLSLQWKRGSFQNAHFPYNIHVVSEMIVIKHYGVDKVMSVWLLLLFLKGNISAQPLVQDLYTSCRDLDLSWTGSQTWGRLRILMISIEILIPSDKESRNINFLIPPTLLELQRICSIFCFFPPIFPESSGFWNSIPEG